MKKSECKIHIVGAGVSGLVAAKVLEDHGYAPVVLEATDRAGGRVKTDMVDNYQLDHGFQVLLTAYPAAQKYLDYDSLELQYFLPGSAVFLNGKQAILGDPIRNVSFLKSAVFTKIGTLGDKFKILQLSRRLKRATISEIFSKEEHSTASYLQDFGFSQNMIHLFFKPFFSGIFLESQLDTSSRMFEFVYKMFGEGYAALPKSGMEAIPKQLAGNLKTTKFRFNTSVKEVTNGAIELMDSERIKSDFTVVATDASGLIKETILPSTPWKSCDTLYFETEDRVIGGALIGLIPDPEALINNICYHTSLKTANAPKQELLSVTIVKDHNLSKEVLIQQAEEELRAYCGIKTKRFLKRYKIPRALPDLRDIQYDAQPHETLLSDGIFLAGDVRLNGSLNAAMISGELAAKGVLDAIEKGVVR